MQEKKAEEWRSIAVRTRGLSRENTEDRAFAIIHFVFSSSTYALPNHDELF